MIGEMDEEFEDEYVAQQEGAAVELLLKEQTAETEKEATEGNRDIEKSLSVLLVDISETLHLMNEQVVWLDEATKTLPKTATDLTITTAMVQSIADKLPTMIQEQCLEEYKKILDNAVKNYNQMQKAATKWQKSIEQEHYGRFRLITISAIMTPILLLLNLIFK